MTTSSETAEPRSELIADLRVPDWEDLGGMMHFKAALVERFGVETGFEHFRATFSGAATLSLRRKPLDGWRYAGVRAGIAFDELLARRSRLSHARARRHRRGESPGL